MRAKIKLESQADVLAFCSIASGAEGEVRVVGHDRGQECSVNAKSLLGLLYCTTWSDLWCVSERDIRALIAPYIVE